MPIPSLWLNTVAKMQYRGVVVKSSCSGLLSSPLARLSLSVLPYKWWSRWLSGLRTHLPKQETRCDPWVRKSPCKKKWQPTPVFLPGKSTDGGAWRATVLEAANSRTRLSD